MVQTEAALVALGANLASAGRGPAETLHEAMARLAGEPGLGVTTGARLWRSPAVPAGSGPDFVNTAVVVETALAPAELLARLHAIETALGRSRPARWAPRACDMDLIAMGARVLPDRATVRRWMDLPQAEACRATPPELILPHPRMHERAFVLAPLAEIAPDWCHPITGLSVAAMLTRLPEAVRAGLAPLDQA